MWPRVMGADCKERGQALTGVRVGRAVSLEKVRNNPVPTFSDGAEGKTRLSQDTTATGGTGGVVEPGTHASFSCGNRESPRSTMGNGAVVRAANPKGTR